MDRSKWQVAIAVINIAVVPLVAFTIRMAQGDTHNEAEETISRFVQDIISRIRHQEMP